MHIAVVPFGPDDPTRELGSEEFRDVLDVAAALQMQVVRDLAPLWGISATISPFMRLADVPTGYWPLVLVDELPEGKIFPRGLHFASGSRPFALVLRKGPHWSRAASHELLEMLCDPWGNFTAPGRALTPKSANNKCSKSTPAPHERQVEYLVEVCDPCQSETYTISGVVVSDFVTPQYYDSFQTRGARYSYTGKVTLPREVLAAGYLTWRQPEDGEVWQAFADETGELGIRPLGGPGLPADVSVREWVDAYPDPPELPDLSDDWTNVRENATKSANDYGKALNDNISRLYKEARGEPSMGLRLSADSAAIRKLYKDLSEDGDERKAFVQDPPGDLARRGIVARGVWRRGMSIPRTEEFEAMLAQLTAQPAELPLGDYWWLGVYGVYGR